MRKLDRRCHHSLFHPMFIHYFPQYFFPPLLLWCRDLLVNVNLSPGGQLAGFPGQASASIVMAATQAPALLAPLAALFVPLQKRGLTNKSKNGRQLKSSWSPLPWRGNPGVIVSTKCGFDCLYPFCVCLCVFVSVCAFFFSVKLLLFQEAASKGSLTKKQLLEIIHLSEIFITWKNKHPV